MFETKIERYFEMLEAGMVEDALQKLKKIWEDPFVSDDLLYTIAENLHHYGFVQEAIEIVQGLLVRYPEENELTLFLAELFVDAGQEEEVLSLLHEIQPQAEEDYIRAVLLSSEIYLMQGLFEVAEHKIKGALRYYPDEKILHSALGEVFYQQENYSLALHSFQRGTEISTYAKMADCYAHVGQFEEALSYYEKALSTQPDQVDLLFGFGIVAHQLQEYDKAIEKLVKVTRLDPFYTSVYPVIVDSYRNTNQVDKALEYVEQGLKYDQYNPHLFYIKGEIHHKLGQLNEAKQQFLRSIEIDDTYLPSLESLVEILKEEEAWEDGIIVLDKMIDVIPERGDLYTKLGQLYEEIEEWSKAEAAYREAIQLDEEDVATLNRLAFLLRDEGKREEAITYWRKSLSIIPDQWEIEEILSEYDAR